MSQKSTRQSDSGTFTLDGTDYGSKSGGPQPLAGLTGLSSGTSFQLTGDAMNPGVQSSTGTISPVAGDLYRKVYGTEPFLVGLGDGSGPKFAVNVDSQTGEVTYPTGNFNNTNVGSGAGGFGYGAPLDPSALGQSAARNQTGSGRMQLRGENFTPGILQQLTGGSSQGNNLIALLQKMKVGSAS